MAPSLLEILTAAGNAYWTGRACSSSRTQNFWAHTQRGRTKVPLFLTYGQHRFRTCNRPDIVARHLGHSMDNIHNTVNKTPVWPCPIVAGNERLLRVRWSEGSWILFYFYFLFFSFHVKVNQLFVSQIFRDMTLQGQIWKWDITYIYLINKLWKEVVWLLVSNINVLNNLFRRIITINFDKNNIFPNDIHPVILVLYVLF